MRARRRWLACIDPVRVVPGRSEGQLQQEQAETLPGECAAGSVAAAFERTRSAIARRDVPIAGPR